MYCVTVSATSVFNGIISEYVEGCSSFQPCIQRGEEVALWPHEGSETECAGRNLQVVSQNCHHW